MVLLLACATPDTATSCEEGRALACACPDGREGAQVCDAKGAWGTCECAATDSPPPDTAETAETAESAETAETAETADTSDTAPPEPEPVQVFLLAGQSNMDGYAYVTGLPPSLQTAQDDVWMYWSGNAAWTALAPASYGLVYYGTEYFGPEVTFGHALANAQPDTQVALIKHAVGGTDLATYWNPGESRADPTMGQGYREFLLTTDEALGQLDAEGVDWQIAGMIWMQGESDALTTQEQAEAYEGNLTRFIARVREDVGAPEMPFVLGKIHCPTCTYGDIVRAGEDAVEAADPLVTAFDTDDLPIHNDGIHYDGSGMRTLGQRFAEPFTGITPAATAQPAFALSGSYQSVYTGNFFLGYELRIDRPITLTDLGTLDLGLTGILYSSQVALYDGITHDLITRTTVPAYYSNPTSPWDQWRYVAIEPIDLEPGVYVLASQVYNGSEDVYIHNAEITAADGFVWLEGRHKDGAAVGLPTNVSSAPANWFGPNLLYVER